MLIVCPACVSSYKVEPGALARADLTLTCAHCRRPMSGLGAAPIAGSTGSTTSVGDERSAFRGVAVAALVLVTASGVLFSREAIARHVPGAAAVFRLAGVPVRSDALVLEDVKTSLGADGLSVEATVANPGRTRMAVPRLHLTIRDGASDALYTWTAPAPKPSLGPGESVAFTSRLDKPPAAGHDLAISFAGNRVAVSDEAARDVR